MSNIDTRPARARVVITPTGRCWPARLRKIEAMSDPNIHASAALLPCEVHETGPEPDSAVIWLHGLGADGHDFEPIVPQLQTRTAGGLRFVFPHAPVRPVTLNGGMPMRAWYDILGQTIDRDQDRHGIDQSVVQVNALIDAQIAQGIPAHRIVLAGFSQGGALALRCGLARPDGLAAVVALSAYLLQADSLGQWLTESGRKTPVWIGHGEHDPIVPMAMGQSAVKQLTGAGLSVSWQTWPMQHSVCMEEIQMLDQWLAKTLHTTDSSAVQS